MADATRQNAACPSFKNTLSAGDRTSLALACFLADLERETAWAQKIVVFDDPCHSQHPDVATSLEKYIGLLRQMHRDAEAQALEARAQAIRARPVQARRTSTP